MEFKPGEFITRDNRIFEVIPFEGKVAETFSSYAGDYKWVWTKCIAPPFRGTYGVGHLNGYMKDSVRKLT